VAVNILKRTPSRAACLLSHFCFVFGVFTMVTVNDISKLSGWLYRSYWSELEVVVCLQVKDEEQAAAKFDAVFPCILRILPACVFNKKDPIIVGVDIEEGIAKVPLTSHMLTFLAAPLMLDYIWHTICQFHCM